MKKVCICLAVILLSVAKLSAQQTIVNITLEEVKQHVGDSVTVCGKVFGTRFLETSNGKPTLINMGGTYPNELMTVVIFGADRDKFTGKPETMYDAKEICITGRIAEYKGKPQIVVAKPEQIIIRQ